MALTETQLEYISTSVEALGLSADPIRPLRLRSLSHEHVRVANHGVVRMPIALPLVIGHRAVFLGWFLRACLYFSSAKELVPIRHLH